MKRTAPSADRQPPAALPTAPVAERRTLQGLILATDPAAVFSAVRSEDFCDAHNKAAFRMLRDTFGDCGRLPPDRLATAWRRYKPLDAVSVAEIFGPDAALHAPHTVAYAREVAEAGRQRRLAVALNHLAERALSEDPAAIARELARLGAAEPSEAGLEVDATYLDELDASILNRERPIDWASPESALADFPLQPGRVVCVGAPPGLGKTLVTQQAVYDALAFDPELHATTVQCEMSPRELVARHYARLSGVDAWQIDRRTFCEQGAERLRAVMAIARPVLKRMHYLRRPLSVAAARTLARSTKSKLVVFDYVQRIDATAESCGEMRERVNRSMDAIREVANEDQVCCVVVAAVSRVKDSAGRASYATDKLGLASLRESGELEYASDSVYLLGETAEEPGSMALVCHKNRGGPKRDIPLRFVANVLRFENPNAWPELATTDW